MLRAISMARVEIDLDSDVIPHGSMGRSANITMQVKIEVSITNRHHVDAPLAVGFPIGADKTRDRPAPAWFYSLGSDRTKKDVRIAVANFYPGRECAFHAVIQPSISAIGWHVGMDALKSTCVIVYL